VTNTTNITSSSLTRARYTRVGSVVTVWVDCQATTTATGNAALTVTLPVASTSPIYILIGTAVDTGNIPVVTGGTTSTTVSAGWYSAAAASTQVRFSFTYEVN
jgi:hypothetical protein